MGQGGRRLAPRLCVSRGHIHEAGAEPVVTIRPKRRPPRSDEAFFATFYRDGLHFGRFADFRPPLTAKPGHALARPGHCLEEDAAPSVKVRQYAHVTRSLAQALITRPQRYTGGHDNTRQKCHIDSTEAPPP